MKKRADGRYCKQILIGYHKDGTRNLKSIYGKTIKEIEKKERELRIQLGDGDYKGEIKTKDWCRNWLNVYKRNVAKSTYRMYSDIIENYIIPTIGNINLSILKPIQIQKALNDIIDRGCYRLAEIYKMTIKQIIKQAIVEGYLAKDIGINLKTQHKLKYEKRALTDFEKLCISEAQYTPPERLFVDILYYTGIRRGEALALTRKDIDFKNHILKINKSVDITNSPPEVKSPKTKAGYRDIPIPDLLYDELLTYVQSCKQIYLFTMRDGKLMTKSSFRKMWANIMKKTKETGRTIALHNSLNTLSQTYEISFTPHIFRHNYATSLYYANIDMKKCQYLLGHSSLDMTLKIYTHLQNIRNDNDLEKLNRLFSQSKVSQIG